MCQKSTQSLRPLLIVEGANPNLTSASLVGWSCARSIAAKTSAHLVTHWRNRDAFIECGLVEGEDFTAIDTRRIQDLSWRVTKTLSRGDAFSWGLYAALSNLVYPFFERAVWHTFKSRLNSGEFDVVHRILPLSPTTPSWLAPRLKHACVPFILGPLNGGVPWPNGFHHLRKAEKDFGGILRPLHRLQPGHRSTYAHASAILAGSRSAFKSIPKRCHDKCIFLPENAIEPLRFPLTVRSQRAAGPLRVVFIGRLVALKGVDMLIEAAIPMILSGALKLEVMGDGPERKSLAEKLESHGIPANSVLIGWIEHKDLSRQLKSADLLAFPSIREFGGGAVLEAMALGVTPVVLNHGGPAELVPPGCGHVLPLASSSQIVSSMRQLFEYYVARPGELNIMGTAAQAHVRRYFTWEARSEQIVESYRWVLNQQDEKPNWGRPLGWPAPSQSCVA